MYTAHNSSFSEIHISTQTFIRASLLLRMHSRKHEWVCKQVAIRLRMLVLKLWNQYEVLSKAFQLKSLSKSPLFSQEGFFKRHKEQFGAQMPLKMSLIESHQGSHSVLQLWLFPTLQISTLFLLYKKSNLDLHSVLELRMKRTAPHTQSIKGWIFWFP